MGSELSEPFEPAEMKPRVGTILETLADHPSQELNRVRAHLKDLWNHPDSFEDGEFVQRWKEDEVLMLVELGVIFGIDYEQAYPEGRHDEWPVPIDDRDSRGESDGE